MSYYSATLDKLNGRKVTAVYIDKEESGPNSLGRESSAADGRIVFVTDTEPVAYQLEGDCCSGTFFNDFIGVRKLLESDRVVSVSGIDLGAASIEYNYEAPLDSDERHNVKVDCDESIDREATARLAERYGKRDELVQFYGYRIVSEHPTFGQVTSVVSFRNESNGYYGGAMVDCDDVSTEGLTLLDDDWLGD